MEFVLNAIDNTFYEIIKWWCKLSHLSYVEGAECIMNNKYILKIMSEDYNCDLLEDIHYYVITKIRRLWTLKCLKLRWKKENILIYKRKCLGEEWADVGQGSNMSGRVRKFWRSLLQHGGCCTMYFQIAASWS